MTLVNLIVGSEAAYLIADSGGYHDDGTLIRVGSKITVADHLKAAVTMSGAASSDTRAITASWLASFKQPDEMLAKLPSLLDLLLADVESVPAEQRFVEPRFVQFYVAHWSDRRGRPEGYIVGSHQGTFGPSYQPRRVCGVDRVIMPSVATDLEPSCFDPETDSLPLVEVQRITPDERGLFRVGGAAELAEVSRAGVSIRRICTWPDKIGEKVNPLGDRVKPVEGRNG